MKNKIIQILNRISNFFSKKKDKETNYCYLIYYQCVVKESTLRNTLTDHDANTYIVNFLKGEGKVALFYQIQNIFGDYYVFYGSELAINKKLYCMMLLLLSQIKNKSYKGADEKYLYKTELINEQEIKIYRAE